MTDTSTGSEFLQAWDSCYRQAVSASHVSVLNQARRSWFDTMAASAAGVSERCTAAAFQACTLSGGRMLHPWDEALVLGTTSHALDYDDVCMLATCHPSAPPVAALLALLPVLVAERPGLRFADALSAYLVGTETTLRLGEWLGFQHYALGFHATGTLGAVGAAAACAHALRMPVEQAHAALSIAASSASGLRANFGTDVKPLHVGFAAAAGLRAVLLVKAGANASDDVWDPAGFFHAFSGGQPAVSLPWKAGMPWAIEQPGFEHKRFPSCYLTHRLIAGILAIRERHPGRVHSRPVRIEIEVPKNGLAPLKHPRPGTGLEGKFSGPYCAAVAWLDGRVELSSFTDAAVLRPNVRAQMAGVTLGEREEAGERLESAPVHVTVSADDWSDTIEVNWAPGSNADPLTREQLLGKWTDCAGRAGVNGKDAVVRLLDAPLDSAAHDLLGPLRELLLTAVRRAARKTTPSPAPAVLTG